MNKSMLSSSYRLLQLLMVMLGLGATMLVYAQAPKPPSLSHKEFNEVIPIVVENNKIFLRAKINNKEFRFIFDSGSPTVITTQAAQAAGLKPVGQQGAVAKNTGTDANGVAVTMDKYQVDTLQLGGVAFSNFTALVFDPSHLPIGGCVLDGGVIGSDLFPQAVWQLNAQDNTLTIASSVKALKYVKKSKNTKEVPLLQFGYPFAPIFDYKVGKHLNDKLMFDTGAPTLVALAKPAYEAINNAREQQGQLGDIGTIVARGYAPESAARITQEQDVVEVPLDSLAIGKLKLTDINASVREKAPSLLGAVILKSHIVTLDYPNKKAYFYAYNTDYKPPVESQVQFRLDGDKVQVSYIGKGSESERRGVQLGHTVWNINGVDVGTINDKNRCEKVRWLLGLKYSPQIEYTLMVNGLEQKIVEKGS